MYVLIRLCITVLLVATAAQLQAADTDTVPSFDAEYRVYYGDMSLGKGKYKLEALNASDANSADYRFSFESSMGFLFFSDKRWVSSEFNVIDNRVQPLRYRHERKGTGADYVDIIDYDRANNTIRSKHKKAVYKFDYDETVRDGLLVQLQLMMDLRKGLKHPKYPILNEDKIKVREFTFVGEEELKVQGETYPCVKYQVVRKGNTRRTVMWFSTAHNFQPVMLAHFTRDKKKFNAQLLSYVEHNP